VNSARIIGSLWRRRWALLRIAAASVLLALFVSDTAQRLARLQLASLPGYDYLAESGKLRKEGRYTEALSIIDAGLTDADLGPDRLGQLAQQKQEVIDEQSSWLRRAREVGIGAVSGQGHTLEGLIGAVGADLFVVGDIRDLLIQGTKLLIDNDADELILLLSAAGVVTTLAPEIDWAPSVLKVARKAGALSTRLVDELKLMLRGGRSAEAARVLADTASLARRASPGGAIRLLRLADSPAEISAMARFAERSPRGAFALGITGRAGADAVIELGEQADKTVLKAAAKGEHGAAWLRTPAARALMRPHPVIGLLKGLRKGTVADLLMRSIERLDTQAWWIIPALACWLLIELASVARSGHRADAQRS